MPQFKNRYDNLLFFSPALHAALVRRQGLTVASSVSHSDVVMQVAAFIGDADAGVQKNAIELLSVLEARLGLNELLQMVSPQKLRDEVGVVLADFKARVDAPASAAAAAGSVASVSAAASSSVDALNVSGSSVSPSVRQWWDALQNGDETAVVDAIRGLCSDMDALAGFRDGANGTVSAIVARLWPSRDADGMRVRKYLVNGLLTVVTNRSCALKVERGAVEGVIRSVLAELCSPSANASADRQAFLKALNVMMFRLLENCRPQLTCAVLVTLLTESIDPASKQDFVPSKTCDLTMKCLVKLSKSLSGTDPTAVEGGLLHWEPAIRAIDSFFVTHAPAVWKTRSNDMPLKAVKTTLSHLCKSLGSEVLSLIDSGIAQRDGPCIIRQYAELMLKAVGKEAPGAAPKSASTASTAAAAQEPSASSFSSVSVGLSRASPAENADPNPTGAEYMAKLVELRRRFNLENIAITPVASTETAVVQDNSANSSEAAEKRIAELRAKLQAARAPYEPAAIAPSSVSASSASATSVKSEFGSTAASTADSAPARPAEQPAVAASDALASIRQRLAKFQAK